MLTVRLATLAAAVGILAVLGHAATPLAQETLAPPAADSVPLHSIVDVSTLPPPAGGQAAGAPVTIKPRYLRTPKAPTAVSAAPITPEDASPPPVAPSRLSVVSAFEGLGNLNGNVPVTGFAAVPSDANLAVGPNHVFEMVNIVGRITNKSGAAISTFSLRSFFQLDMGSEESDPSVIYDAATDRWFAIYLQPTSTQSTVVLAVSTSGDPTATFCRFRLGNATAETFLQDFPQLGISDDKVIVTYNGFNLAGTSFLGAGYYVLNKADLVAGGGCPSSVRRVRVAPNLARYGVMPARSISSTSTLYMATNDALVPGGSRVLVIGVNGVPGVGAVTEDTFTVTVRTWQAPPNAEQPSSSVALATNDESVITAVWQNGALWIGGNEQCVPAGDSVTRSCLRLVQIRTDVRGLAQDITSGSAGRHFYYPALSPDGGGNLVVVFNSSSAAEFASVRATGRLVSDPPNTLVPSIVLRGGSGAQTNSGRMGDFYGAAMDPADPSKVWVTAEYMRATGQGDWGTTVVQLTFGPPPTLGIALNGHTFTTGSVLRLDLSVDNPFGPFLADVYLGAVLPSAAGPTFGCAMGDAIAFVSGSGGVVVRCRSASAATFPTYGPSAFFPAGPSTFTSFFTFTWPSAPAGAYVVFVAFAVPGSLDDGTIGPGDIIAIVGDTVTFSP